MTERIGGQKGSLITFEGVDFSGKTTQVQLLKERLKREGHQVVLVREPGGTKISEGIRRILLDRENERMEDFTELLLYVASRAQLTQEIIIPALREGKIVLCDRYADSSLAYQGYGRGLDLDLVKRLNHLATEGLTPHLTFVFDINIEEAEGRRLNRNRAGDRLEEAGRVFFNRVRFGYRKIGEEERSRVVVLDGSRGIEELQEEVWKWLKPLVKESTSQ